MPLSTSVDTVQVLDHFLQPCSQALLPRAFGWLGLQGLALSPRPWQAWASGAGFSLFLLFLLAAALFRLKASRSSFSLSFAAAAFLLLPQRPLPLPWAALPWLPLSGFGPRLCVSPGLCFRFFFGFRFGLCFCLGRSLCLGFFLDPGESFLLRFCLFALGFQLHHFLWSLWFFSLLLHLCRSCLDFFGFGTLLRRNFLGKIEIRRWRERKEVSLLQRQALRNSLNVG